jgi:cytochrome c
MFVRLTLLALPLLGLSFATAPASAQDAAAGGQLFTQRCQTCHSVNPAQKTGIAPNLAGVVGRKAASTGFAYSDALKKSGLTWTPANLDKFLTSPFKMVPGTRMVISVSDEKQRADLIAFLASKK